MTAFIGHTFPHWGFNSGIGFGVRSDTILSVLPRLKKRLGMMLTMVIFGSIVLSMEKLPTPVLFAFPLVGMAFMIGGAFLMINYSFAKRSTTLQAIDIGHAAGVGAVIGAALSFLL